MTLGGTDAAAFTSSFGGDGWEIQSATLTFGDGGQSYSPDDSHVYSSPGTYTATLSGTDLLGRPLKTARVKVTVGDSYWPFPYGLRRVYHGRVPAHGVVKLTAARLRGGYHGTFRAAFTDVTAGGARKAGEIAVYPDGATKKAVTVVAFGRGRPASGTALATLGAGKKVDFANRSGGPVELTITAYGLDTTGASPGGGGYDYSARPPVPLRSPRRVAAHGQLGVKIVNAHGVKNTARAVVLDVTVAHDRAAGYLTGCGGYNSSAPHCVSWAAGQRVTTLVVVPADGYNWAYLYNVSKGSAVIGVSLVGYYGETGATLVPTAPERVLRLRIQARHTVTVPIGGRDGLPPRGTEAALVSLTARGATKAGTIDGWAASARRPAVPVLSYATGTAAGTALIDVSPNGKIKLRNSGPRAVTLTVTLLGAYYRH